MAVSYPLNIPIGLVSGNSHNDSNKVASNNVATGPPRFELISVNTPVFFKINWLFTDLEMQIFDGWYKFDLTYGVKSFDMNIKIGGGLRLHEVYLSGGYSVSQSDKHWKVKASLIGLSKQYDDQAAYDAAKALAAS